MTKKNATIVGDDEPSTDLPQHLQTRAGSAQPPTGKTRETAAEAAARIRAEREGGTRPRALDGTTKRLEVFGEIPGYHLAILNDEDNRLYQAQLHGWAFVDADEIGGVNENVTSFNTDPGERVRFVVGTKKNGEALHAYLMKLPEEIWQDDQQAHHARDQYVDAQIRGGHAPGETTDDQESRYNVRTTVDQIGLRRQPSNPS